MIREGNGLDYLLYSDADIDYDTNFQTQSLRIKDPLLDNSHSYNIDNFITYIETEESSSKTFLSKIEGNKSKFILSKLIANLQVFQKLVNNIINNLNCIDGDFANLDVYTYIQSLIKIRSDKIQTDKNKDLLEQAREFKQLNIAFEALNVLLTKNFSADISVKLLKHDFGDDIKLKVYVSLKE